MSTSSLTYQDEDGNTTALDLSAAVASEETLTSLGLNVDNTNLDYVDEDGTTNKVNLTNAVTNLETNTTLSLNNTGALVYTNEDGNNANVGLISTAAGNKLSYKTDGLFIDGPASETLTSIALNADNTNLDYVDEDGTTNKVDLTNAVTNLETNTTLSLNADNTNLDYVDEDGTTNKVNLTNAVTNLETNTTLSLNADNTNLDYVDEDGTTNKVDLTNAVTNLETNTTLSLNADNTNLDYVDEDGTTNKVNLTNAVTNLETNTTLSLNNTGALVYANEDGNNANIGLISTASGNKLSYKTDGLFMDVTANNGLSVDSGTGAIQLGGTLTAATTINLDNNDLRFNGGPVSINYGSTLNDPNGNPLRLLVNGNTSIWGNLYGKKTVNLI